MCRDQETEVAPTPLELEIYIVKISKIRKKFFFLSIGPPLGKNRSLAPADDGRIECCKLKM